MDRRRYPHHALRPQRHRANGLQAIEQRHERHSRQHDRQQLRPRRDDLREIREICPSGGVDRNRVDRRAGRR